MKRIFYIFMMLAGLWTMSLTSCTEVPVGQPPVDGTPPPPLRSVNVEALPGGAKITYVLPNDPDISYVKGEFMFQGKKKVVRSSVYDNFLIVEGLSSQTSVDLSLSLVDHSENASTPEIVTFTPLISPLESIYKTIKLAPDWGGVLVQWENPLAAEIGIYLLVDSAGILREITNDANNPRFPATKETSCSFRGFPNTTMTFGIVLIDKWGNKSDTLRKAIIPDFEMELVKDYPNVMHERWLPWDNTSNNGNYTSINHIFDGITDGTGNSQWHTGESQLATRYRYTIPVLFTIDLGVMASLSRFKLWQARYQVNGAFLYAHHAFRFFEVWGTTDLKLDEHPLTPDDATNTYWLEDWKQDWTLLGDFELIRPSGYSIGTDPTDEDWRAIEEGHEFFPLSTTVRYLRFAVKATWNGPSDNAITLQEISFWGRSEEIEEEE
jgi:hypothetical protein